jgi:hypothetical protein
MSYIDEKKVKSIVDEMLQLLLDRKVTIQEAAEIGMVMRLETSEIIPPNVLFTRHSRRNLFYFNDICYLLEYDLNAYFKRCS